MQDVLSGYMTYTTWTPGVPSVDLDSLLVIVREWKAKAKQTDDDMIAALKRHIGVSGESLPRWADRFGIPFIDFMETLHGLRPVSGYFWEQLRRVFAKDV